MIYQRLFVVGVIRTMSVSMEDLEISLYTAGASDDELCGVSSILSQGRLSLSLVHDTRNDCLIVNLHKAVALRVASAGKVNNYIFNKKTFLIIFYIVSRPTFSVNSLC